jgi:uncharacterized protein YndB with AHSA1/START domain
MKISDRPTVQVEIDIDAPRSVVWSLITDPARMGEFSPENLGGTWDLPHAGPAVGARFTSRNRWEGMEWETTSIVVQCEPERVFSFAVSDVEQPSATWRYQLHPRKGGGTRLVESMEFGPGPSGTTARIAEVPDKEEFVIAARTLEHAEHMRTTLDRIRETAEREANAERPSSPA